MEPIADRKHSISIHILPHTKCSSLCLSTTDDYIFYATLTCPEFTWLDISEFKVKFIIEEKLSHGFTHILLLFDARVR